MFDSIFNHTSGGPITSNSKKDVGAKIEVNTENLSASENFINENKELYSSLQAFNNN